MKSCKMEHSVGDFQDFQIGKAAFASGVQMMK